MMDLTEEKIRDYVLSMAGTSQKYVSERDIAQKFSLNRSNSRKLLLGLEGAGVLQCVPQKGYRFVDYSNTSDDTVYTVRLAIESEAARLAAERATREDILKMALILDEAQNAVEQSDYQNFPLLDDDFHRALVDASHDNMLIKLFSFILIPMFRSDPWPDGSLRETHENHKVIFEAVRAHDAVAAATAILQHLGSFNVDEKDKEAKGKP